MHKRFQNFLFCTSLGVAIVLGAATGTQIGTGNVDNSNLLLENAEALSSPEYPNMWIDCTWNANTHCVYLGCPGHPEFDRPDATYIWLVI